MTAPTTPVPASELPADDVLLETGTDVLDGALDTLRANAAAWVATSPGERVRLLERVLVNAVAVADRWAAACIEAEGLDPADPSAGEEALVGPMFFIRNVRLLRDALRDIDRGGVPRIAGPVRTRPDGQVAAQVFPASMYDRLFYLGITGEVWMEPGVTAAELPATQALAYRGDVDPTGRICLVLGAGNVSSIGPMDIISKLFVENSVVLCKLHPVNAYLGPILELALRPLIERGVVRFVSGGADVGAILCRHPEVDEIHMTGSDRTYDAIVYGVGPDGRDRRARDERLIDTPVSAELGNVSPVIVVPGRWSAGDIASQAENIATMLTNNGGFNCNAARVIVTHAGWPQRRQLLAAIRDRLARTKPRVAYYPGADARFDAFVAAHPEARQLGPRTTDRLPWTIVEGVDPEQPDDICFTTELFCSIFAETALAADFDGRLHRPGRRLRERAALGDPERDRDRPPANRARPGRRGGHRLRHRRSAIRNRFAQRLGCPRVRARRAAVGRVPGQQAGGDRIRRRRRPQHPDVRTPAEGRGPGAVSAAPEARLVLVSSNGPPADAATQPLRGVPVGRGAAANRCAGTARLTVPGCWRPIGLTGRRL